MGTRFQILILGLWVLALGACSGSGSPAGLAPAEVLDAAVSAPSNAALGPNRPPLTAEIDPQDDCRYYINENLIAEAPEACKEIIENILNMPRYEPNNALPMPQRAEIPQIVGPPVIEQVTQPNPEPGSITSGIRVEFEEIKALPRPVLQFPAAEEDSD